MTLEDQPTLVSFPRVSRLRRAFFAVLLVVLVGGIVGYWKLTHPDNIRHLAQQYLSRVTGGHAVVGHASLTLFEGLRLGDIAVYVEPDDPEPIFSAKACSIEYVVPKLLLGRIEARRIVALEPHVSLVEDTQAGSLNLVTMLDRRREEEPDRAHGPLKLPEVVLRAGRVAYNTTGPDKLREASVMLEGQLTPVLGGFGGAPAYAFRLIGTGGPGVATGGVGARGPTARSAARTAADGPVIAGRLRLEDFLLEATLENYRLESEVSRLLPEKVNAFFADHELIGRVDVTGLAFAGPRDWSAEITLAGVQMSLLPERLLRNAERQRLTSARRVAGALAASLPTSDELTGTFADATTLRPIALTNVAGRLLCSEDKLVIRELAGDVAQSRVGISGTLNGYRFGAESNLLVRSVGPLRVGTDDGLVASLPPAVREAFHRFRPAGRGRLGLQLTRDGSDDPIRLTGRLDVIDASATFDRVPYRVHGIRGAVVLGHDAATGDGFVRLEQLTGHGPAGTPNETSRITLDGRISPLADGAGFDLNVSGRNVTGTPRLLDALPTNVRRIVADFAEPQQPYPTFAGDFDINILRPRGPDTGWSYDTDITLRNLRGRAEAFAYPIRNGTGRVKVRSGHVLIEDMTMLNAGGEVRVDGRVDWRRPDGRPGVETRLDVVASNVPVDEDLLAALPEGIRPEVAALGLRGRLAATGDVRVVGEGFAGTDLNLKLELSQGELFAGEGRYTLHNVRASIELVGGQLRILSATARRGAGQVEGGGLLDWSGPYPRMQLAVQGTQMQAEAALRTLLPPAGVEAFDMLRPEGPFDARFAFDGPAAQLAGRTEPPSLQSPNTPPLPPADFRLELTPQGMAATFKPVPYPLSDVRGKVLVTPSRIELHDLTARRDAATLSLSGVGATEQPAEEGQMAWSLQLALNDAPVDAALKAAVPEGARRLLESMSVAGRAGIRFDRLTLTPRPAPAVTDDLAAEPEPEYDVNFDAVVWADTLSLDAGVGLSDVKGWLKLTGAGTTLGLGSVSGEAAVESLSVGGREGRNLSFKLAADEAADSLVLEDIRGQVAGGEIGGRLVTGFSTPQEGEPANTYQLTLAIRDADAAAVAQADKQEVDGRISASLNLTGSWDDPRTRRGRGDVLVEGQKLYRVPLLLGLMQVANLSLPVREPFREVKAAYSVDGPRVNLESISLQAANMRLNGSGSIDLTARDVDLTFTTENTGLPNLPIIGEVIEGAKDELLRIRVRGKLDAPAVGTGSLESLGKSIEETP